MVPILKDLLGITSTDYDYLFVTFSLFMTTISVFYMFQLITQPIQICLQSLRK